MCHLATYFLDVSFSNIDEIVLTEYLVDIAASRASGVFLLLRLSQPFREYLGGRVCRRWFRSVMVHI